MTRNDKKEWESYSDGTCYNPNFRGVSILFKNKTGEIYKYFEKEQVFTPEDGPGGYWSVIFFNDNLIVRNENYTITTNWYEFINGEFKLIKTHSKSDTETNGYYEETIDINEGTYNYIEDIKEYIDEATEIVHIKQKERIVINSKVSTDYLPGFPDGISDLQETERSETSISY